MLPETFEDAMQRRIGRDFRLRWCVRTQVWAIEQKVGRGTVEIPVDYSDPAYERVRDGYAPVMEIAASPVIRCKECSGEVPVPFGKFGEVRCPRCELMGERTLYFVGYFPLSDLLLNHLDKLSPKRSKEAHEERKRANYERERTAKRDYENRFDAWAREYHPHIVGVPQVGYTGASRR